MAAEPQRKPVDAERARRAANVKATSIKPVEPAEETEEWVVSYMDMVTVLMTVFLGMLALMGMDGRIANPTDKERADAAVVEKVLEEPHPVAVVEPVLPSPAAADSPAPMVANAPTRPTAAPVPMRSAADDTPSLPPPARDRELSPGARQWLAHLEAMGLPPEVDITTQDRKVSIVVRDRILFNSGSATLQPDALDLLRKLTPNLLAVPGSITVEGHSDDVAIRTVRFPSNWELSAARAAAVVRALEAFGVPTRRLGALGLADSRPVTDDPARRSENRRVEIVIDTDADMAQSATR